MSTLRTFNLQHPESSNNNIQLAEGGGVSVTAGILTATNVSSTNVTTTEVTATNGTFSGNLSVGGVLSYEDVTNVDSTGIGTFRDGLHVTGGSVGIGTDNANVDLHLHDSSLTRIQFTDDSTGAAAGDGVIMGLNGDDDFFINNRESSKNLLLFTENEERLRINSDGNIGIGTDTPYTNNSFNSLSIGGSGKYGLIELVKSNGIAGSWIDAYGTNGDGNLRFTTAGTSGAITFWTGGEFTEKVRITSAGLVGVNVIPTQQKLTIDVDSSGTTQASFDGINICNTDSTTNNGAAIVFGQAIAGNSYARIGVINSDRSGGSEDQDIFFGTLGGGSYAERLRITSTGKLRVIPADTSSSYAATDGGIDIAQIISSTGSSSSQSTGIQFSLNKSGETGAISEIGAIRTGNGESGLVFRTRDNSTGRNERLRIISDGKVGINSTSPTARLDINHLHTEQGLVVRSRYGNINTAMVKFDTDPYANGGDGNVVHIHGGNSRTDSEILHVNSTGQGTIFQIRGDGLTRVYKHLQLEHASNTAKIIFNEYGANDIKAQIEMDQVNGSNGQLRFYTQGNGTLSERMRILNDGMIETNGVMNYYAAFQLANNGYYYWDIPVPNEGGYGNSFRCECGYNHYYSAAYGAHRSAWISSRGTSTNAMLDQDQNHSQAGAWSFSKPNSTTFRVEKSAGTYGGSGYGFIHVRFNSF